MNQKTTLSFEEIPHLSLLRASFPGLRALLFDMDGTIFDTERYHAQAMQEMGREHRIRAPFSPQQTHELMVGKADYLVFEIIRHWEGFPVHWSVSDFIEDKNRRLIKILQGTKLEAFLAPEILELIFEGRTAGLFLGLVTSSEKAVTRELLSIAGLEHAFDLQLTRDDCPKHKPDPWPYVEAMRIAGTGPEETLIFEDSQVGLAAALASWAHVIKVEWY